MYLSVCVKVHHVQTTSTCNCLWFCVEMRCMRVKIWCRFSPLVHHWYTNDVLAEKIIFYTVYTPAIPHNKTSLFSLGPLSHWIYYVIFDFFQPKHGSDPHVFLTSDPLHLWRLLTSKGMFLNPIPPQNVVKYLGVCQPMFIKLGKDSKPV